MLDSLFDPLLALIGGPKQLPLYLYFLPIPILLWLFWAEFRAAASRDPATGDRFLYPIDGLNSAVGKTYGWSIVVLTFTFYTGATAMVTRNDCDSVSGGAKHWRIIPGEWVCGSGGVEFIKR